MEQFITNHSSTTVDAVSEPLDAGIREGYIRVAIEALLVVLCAVGTPGNVLLFRVAHFMVETKRKTGYVLLRLVAAVDIGGLTILGVFELLAIASPVNQDNNELLCKTFYGTTYSCLYASSFIIVAMSVERLYAAANTVGYRDNVTKAGMTKVGIGCALYAVATNLPVAMSPLFDNTHGICFGVNENLGEVSRGMAVAVVFAHFFVLPSVVALVCVVAAIVKLLFTQDSSPQATDLEAFRTLLAASGVFLASNCLFLVYGIMHEFVKTIEDGTMNSTQRSLVVLFNASVPLLFVIHSSANFPVLYYFSKKFRENVAALRSQ